MECRRQFNVPCILDPLNVQFESARSLQTMLYPEYAGMYQIVNETRIILPNHHTSFTNVVTIDAILTIMNLFVYLEITTR